jgi:magnesium chelatase subunit D
MSAPPPSAVEGTSWAEAVQACSLLALDPLALGGAVIRGLPGPARERWLALLRGALPEGAPLRTVPHHSSEDRLLGGLDLPLTLKAGRQVVAQGLLAAGDGGLLVLAMAERLPAATAARIAHAQDRGAVSLEREGFSRIEPTRFGVIALDEAEEDEPRPSAVLQDRLAFDLDLRHLSHRDLRGHPTSLAELRAARRRLPAITPPAELLSALAATAMALGIASLRAPLLALAAARATAAIAGRNEIEMADAELATRLVLVPRATCLPADMSDQEEELPEPPAEEPDPGDEEAAAEQPLEDRLLQAAIAALPPGLLDRLRLEAGRGSARTAGKAGAEKKGGLRGRPAGIRQGLPGPGQRLGLIETLHAAAPFQALRRRRPADETPRLQIRCQDFRVVRRKERRRTTLIFVVDASGSSAVQRLAEAKGAVELLLAECYRRRDQVALLAFRGSGAELLLPPTRSLPRAKRCLAALPGGGGTPLAAGIEASLLLAEAAARRGETPVLVYLTDGRANIARDGSPGRSLAAKDALALARRAAGRHGAQVIDIASRPAAEAEALAAAFDARYLPLPAADARGISTAMVGMLRP